MTMIDETAVRVPRTDPLYAEVHDWLDDEAAILDRNQYAAWEALLDPEVTYSAPVRENVYRSDGEGIADGYAHFQESYSSLKFRVERLSSPLAWAENPFSRTRRFVTNVRVFKLDADSVQVESHLLLMRNRSNEAHFDTIPCLREDVLRRSAEGGLRLFKRRIIMDQVTLGTINLSLFL